MYVITELAQPGALTLNAAELKKIAVARYSLKDYLALRRDQGKSLSPDAKRASEPSLYRSSSERLQARSGEEHQQGEKRDKFK